MTVIENHAVLFDLLKQAKKFSFDSETTGLNWQKGDYAFLWAFATDTQEFIVDLRRTHTTNFYDEFYKLLQDPEIHLIGTNTKFDLHMALSQRRTLVSLNARISDTTILMRLYDSDALRVGLEATGELVGIPKDDTVKKWIQKNKAYRYDKLPNGELEKIPRFDIVPDEILYRYASIDARVTYDGFIFLNNKLCTLDTYNRSLSGDKSIFKVIKKEEDLLKTLFHMERRGVLLDYEYTSKGLHSEENRHKCARTEIEEITGRTFIDSSKALIEIFGVTSDIIRSAPRTEKGNVSFTDSFLSSVEHPVAKAIIRYRKAYKKSGTYYANFIHLSDNNRIIHTNFRQSQTSTGRLSCSSPNLQNVSNDDDSEFPIRGCFISPPDFYIVSIDYQAQEMRMMLDMAGEKVLADEIIAGKDVHQATADLVGVSRKQAKTISFGLLYSMGVTKLAGALGVSLAEGQELRNEYFKGLRNVESFIGRVMRKAEKGMISNIAGRIYKFEKKYSYKAVNYLIQGSSSEITKTAMIGCEDFLSDKESKLVLSVHDELVFYVHKNELDMIPKLATIMKESYTHDILPMDVGIEIGTRWSEMEDYSEWLEKQKQSSQEELEKT
jgi:DNA polymerase-1